METNLEGVDLLTASFLLANADPKPFVTYVWLVESDESREARRLNGANFWLSAGSSECTTACFWHFYLRVTSSYFQGTISDTFYARLSEKQQFGMALLSFAPTGKCAECDREAWENRKAQRYFSIGTIDRKPGTAS